MPVQSFILPVLWLVSFDVITGIYVSRFISNVEITSRRLFRKLPQLAMFFVAMSAALHADPFFVQFGLSQFQSTKFVISFYGLYELFSILENLGKAGLPVAKQLANILKSKLPEDVSKNLETQNEQ
jgi:phage-related holin